MAPARPNVPKLPRKASDHALDATRYALHSELGRLARAEAMLAELRSVGPHPPAPSPR